MAEQFFEVPSAIADCADVECPKYALGGVHVTSRPGGVFLTATDSRFLAVVEAAGQVDAPVILSASLLREAEKSKSKVVELKDGSWRAKTNEPKDYRVEGKFPRAPDVLPDSAGRMALSIDVDYLLRLAKAIACRESEDGQMAVTLLIGKDELAPIGVIGGKGVGVLMPVVREDLYGNDITPQRYEALRKEFAMFYPPKPGPPPDLVALGM